MVEDSILQPKKLMRLAEMIRKRESARGFEALLYRWQAPAGAAAASQSARNSGSVETGAVEE